MAQSGSMKLLGARNMSCIVERMEWNNKMDLIAYGTEKGALNPMLEVRFLNYNLYMFIFVLQARLLYSASIGRRLSHFRHPARMSECVPLAGKWTRRCWQWATAMERWRC